MNKHNKIFSIIIVTLLSACFITIASSCTSSSNSNTSSQPSNSSSSVSKQESLPLVIATRDASKTNSMQDTILIYEDGSVQRVISFDQSTKDAVEANNLTEIEKQLKTNEQFPTQVSISPEDMKTIKTKLLDINSEPQNVTADENCDWYIFALNDNSIVKIITDDGTSDLTEANATAIKDILLNYWNQS